MTLGDKPDIELDSPEYILQAKKYFVSLLKDKYSSSDAFLKTSQKYGSYAADEAFDWALGIRR